jgi:para-nitrobenzyl esterase
MTVGTLPSMPRAEGLFRRAIAQSGAAHHVISAATAQRVRRCLAGKLGVEQVERRSQRSRLTACFRPAELDADLPVHPD